MTLWLIDPQDTLLFRDGRPFSANPGARARSLQFPFPTTTAGAARTRAGQDSLGRFDTSRIDDVLKVSLRGPLLAALQHGRLDYLLPPAPADALAFVEDSNSLVVHPLQPIKLPSGTSTDLGNVPGGEELAPVGLSVNELRKPAKDSPAFWKWSFFADWLLSPTTQKRASSEIGIGALASDRRLHVGIDPQTLAGRDGDLFMTGGLAFRQQQGDDPYALSAIQELGLIVSVHLPDDGLSIDPGVGHVGGERRLAHWRSTQGDFPDPPPGLKEQVKTTCRCRVVLLTPLATVAGWRPTYLLQSRHGVAVELIAAAVGKPQTLSGWDLRNKGARLSRRLVPAGSVFYLELTGEPDAIENWFDKTWFHCLSDEEDDRMCGFGLAVVGTYSGPVDLEIDNIQKEAHDA